MKYFFIDIDNTLTKFLRSVSDENLKALSYVLNHGDQVVLCSGRSSASCENIKKTIEEYAKKQMKYGIFSNGGYIVDFSTNQITTNLIPNDTVWKIYDYVKKNKYGLLAYTPETNEQTAVYSMKTWYKLVLFMNKKIDLWKIKDNSILDAYKLIIYSIPLSHRLPKLIEWINTNFSTELSVIRTHKYVIEVNKKGINKAFGINYVKQKEGTIETISIGDSRNDIPSFEATDNSFAVNTKNPVIIKKAKNHIRKFKNSVAKVIKKVYGLEDDYKF